MVAGSPASGLARIVMVVLTLGVVLAALAAVSSFSQADLIARVIAGGDFIDAELEASDTRQQLIGIAQIGLGVTSGVLFLVWVHRARRALDVAGVTGLRFTPGWAVGWFFVPIFNAFRPYQVMAEIHKASDPERPSDWKDRRETPLIAIWWTAFILSGVFDRVLLASLRGTAAEQILTSTRLTVWSDVIGGIIAILAFLVVRAIDARQQALFANALLAASPRGAT